LAIGKNTHSCLSFAKSAARKQKEKGSRDPNSLLPIFHSGGSLIPITFLYDGTLPWFHNLTPWCSMDRSHHGIPTTPMPWLRHRQALPKRSGNRPTFLFQFSKRRIFVNPASSRVFGIVIQQKPIPSKEFKPGKLMHQTLSSVEGLLRSTHWNRPAYFAKRSNRIAGKIPVASPLFRLGPNGNFTGWLGNRVENGLPHSLNLCLKSASPGMHKCCAFRGHLKA